MSEYDNFFENAEPDPFEFWREKQRELITNVVDYNLITLANLVSEENISLKPKYQRRFRFSWLSRQKDYVN